jgi:cytochrome c oxidase assembly factor CtaG
MNLHKSAVAFSLSRTVCAIFRHVIHRFSSKCNKIKINWRNLHWKWHIHPIFDVVVRSPSCAELLFLFLFFASFFLGDVTIYAAASHSRFSETNRNRWHKSLGDFIIMPMLYINIRNREKKKWQNWFSICLRISQTFNLG